MNKKLLVIWDFDATLAQRLNPWSGSLKELLDESIPGHGLQTEAIRREVLAALPWENTDLDHQALTDPAAWWAQVGGAIGRGVYQKLLGRAASPEDFLPQFKRLLFDPSRYVLSDNCLEVLEKIKTRGATQVILSNNAPEVKDLAHNLGVGAFMDHIIAASTVGLYKPNPKIYEMALARSGFEARNAIMIGDNFEADVLGPEAVGIRGIHFCAKHSNAHRVARSLNQVLQWVT